MSETLAPAKDLGYETKRRLRRTKVFARAAELGAVNHQERWTLLGLSRPTYFRLLGDKGCRVQLNTAMAVLDGLKWTNLDDAFEEVA